jgi:predicted nucleotidyltransferase
MGLIDFIKRKPEVRKIFGERELKIIEKQLLGVNLTQSEKNRLSRDIRKKLEVIKELSEYKEEFELKKGADNKKIMQNIKKIILEDEIFRKIEKIVLFGSTAEKENTLLSDLDIAVQFDDITEKEAISFRLRIARNTSEKVDVQVYNLLPEKIKKEIDEKGKIIWARKN